MGRRAKRSSDGGLLDVAEEFRDLPFYFAALGAAIVLVALEVVAPIVVRSTSTTSPAGVNYAVLFLPLIQGFGWLFAGAILVFGLVGIVSRRFDRWQDGRNLNRQRGLESIRALSWLEFERVIGEAYRRAGYQVRQRGGPQADGGADLEISRNGERLLVQAKHWKTRLVRLPQVRELWGAVADEHADGAVLVTSGSFTRIARSWTQAKNYRLIDGEQLIELLRPIQEHIVTQQAALSPASRMCRVCGAPMVLRMARRGVHAGEEFWGCSRYPACRNVESAAAASTRS